MGVKINRENKEETKQVEQGLMNMAKKHRAHRQAVGNDMSRFEPAEPKESKMLQTIKGFFKGLFAPADSNSSSGPVSTVGDLDINSHKNSIPSNQFKGTVSASKSNTKSIEANQSNDKNESPSPK